jgi:hypothetical protein
MHENYQRAAKVVVWLGPASQNSNFALTFLVKMSLKCFEDLLRKVTRIPVQILLMNHLRSLPTDPRNKFYALVSIAGQYNGQETLKVDYSASKRDAYIETARCLIYRLKTSGRSPLNVIGYVSDTCSDGSLPSRVSDWSPSQKAELEAISDYYNSNWGSVPTAIYKI